METLTDTLSHIRKVVPAAAATPDVAIVCGSGLGTLASTLTDALHLPYASIPHFPQATVAGHAGELVFGRLGGKQIVCMVGRFHYYEGHSIEKTIFPIRLMHLLGAKVLVVTNAAGALNPDYNVGDLMIIHDHLSLPSLAGLSPLRGPNDEALGPRFPPLSNAYPYELRVKAVEAASYIPELAGNVIREGVYTFVGGPTYETPAEARALRSLGGDVVGMSTVPEVIAAAHCGLPVLGISLVTNKVASGHGKLALSPASASSEGPGQEANHAEVLSASAARAAHVLLWVEQIVASL